jgi:hypothetical protein
MVLGAPGTAAIRDARAGHHLRCRRAWLDGLHDANALADLAERRGRDVE